MSAPPVQLLSASPEEADTAGASPIAIAASNGSRLAGDVTADAATAHVVLSTSPDNDDADGESLFANAPDMPVRRAAPLPFRRRAPPPPPQPARNETLSTMSSSSHSHSSHASGETAPSVGTASSTPSRAGTALSGIAGAEDYGHTFSSGRMTASPSSTMMHQRSLSPSPLQQIDRAGSPASHLRFQSPHHARTTSTSSVASSLGVAHVPSPAYDRKGHDAYTRSQQQAQHSRHLSSSSSTGAVASGSGAGWSSVTGAELSSSPGRSTSAFSFGYRETLDARTENLADGSRTINQYRMLEEVGRGAYGTVYRAELLSDPNITFAIKEFGKMRFRKNYRASNLRRTARMRGRGRPAGIRLGSTEPSRADSALAKTASLDDTVKPSTAPLIQAAVSSEPQGPAGGEVPNPPIVASPTDEAPPILSSSPTSTAEPGCDTEAIVRGVEALQVAANAGASSPEGPSAQRKEAGPAEASPSSSPVRGSTLETDPLFLIRHEIAILKKLNHPNVVKLYEVLDDPSKDSLYMVFENCPDGPVIDVHMHEQSEPLNEDDAREYFAQILLGIEYLHSNEIVHRDIKPDNILLTSNRQICKIVDFGVSEIFLKPDAEKMAKTAGTPAFMSPELCTPGSGDLHAMADDIWALGVTLYCMVVGRLPFEKSQVFDLYEAIKNDEPNYPDHLSPGLLDLLQGLLRKDASTRYGIPEARVHPWVTYDGTYPLVSVEENLETVVQEVTEEELERAICKITSVFTIARAVQKFKRAGSTSKSRTLSSGHSAGSKSQPGSAQGTFSDAAGGPSSEQPLLASLVTSAAALDSGGTKGMKAATMLSPMIETASELETDADEREGDES